VTISAGDTLFFFGATGFIGTHTVRHLRKARPGVRILALVRRTDAADELSALGVEPLIGDILDAEGWREQARGADLIVHLAQPAAIGKRVGRKQGRAYEAARLQMDRKIFDALRGGRARRVVYVSGHSYYGATGPNHTLDESMPRRPIGFGPYIETSVAEALEEINTGLDAVLLFPGAVYGNGSWLREYTLDPLRAGKPVGELAGRPRFASPIHVDDVARAVEFSLDASIAAKDADSRCFLVVDDLPITYHELNLIAGRAIGKDPRFRKIPGFLFRAFAGAVIYDYMAADCRYSNARLKSAGFQLKYPTAELGITALLGESVDIPA